MNIETLRNEYLEKLSARKADAERNLAKSGENSTRGKRAKKFLDSYDAKVADASVFFTDAEVAAFVNAANNDAANAVFHSFADKYDGYFASKRNATLFSLRADFVLERKSAGLRSTREADFQKAEENRRLHEEITRQSHDGGTLGYRRL